MVIDVFATADVEYAGILIPIQFDLRYLRLDRADQDFNGGIASTNYPAGNNSGGYVVVYSGLSTGSRRLAAEGEEVHAATLYFEVLAAANRIAQTRVKVGGTG